MLFSFKSFTKCLYCHRPLYWTDNPEVLPHRFKNQSSVLQERKRNSNYSNISTIKFFLHFHAKINTSLFYQTEFRWSQCWTGRWGAVNFHWFARYSVDEGGGEASWYLRSQTHFLEMEKVFYETIRFPYLVMFTRRWEWIDGSYFFYNHWSLIIDQCQESFAYMHHLTIKQTSG